MPLEKVRRLASAWVSAQEQEHHARSDAAWQVIFQVSDLKGEALWTFICAVMDLHPSDEVQEILAASPLEDLIEYEGELFVNRVEQLAAKDATFAALLAHVWLIPSTDEVRQRYAAMGCQLIYTKARPAPDGTP